MLSARSIKVHGVVQGVGFRPFVFRLARANTLAGWVLNAEEGVEIFLEGADQSLASFVQTLQTEPPPAAVITGIEVRYSNPIGLRDFTIRETVRREHPTVRISPDLPVCGDCLRELFDPADRRYQYPYINCTNCGPRYTVTTALPYDRANTTMKAWPLDEFCARGYGDPSDRRFHAQPVACPSCGPGFYFRGHDDRGARKWREHCRGRGVSARREDRGDQRDGRLSPGVRRAKCPSRGGFAQPEISQGEAVCSDGAEH